MFVKDIFYTVPLRLPETISKSEFIDFVHNDEIIQNLQKEDKLFLYIPDKTSKNNILSIYDAIDMFPPDKIVGSIVTIGEDKIDFFLYQKSVYGAMVNYLLQAPEQLEFYVIPHIIIDKTTNKIKSIYKFSLQFSDNNS